MHLFISTVFIEMLSFAVSGIALGEMKEKWGCSLRLVLLIKVLFGKGRCK